MRTFWQCCRLIAFSIVLTPHVPRAQELFSLPVKEAETRPDSIAAPSPDSVAAGDTINWSSTRFFYEAQIEKFTLMDRAVMKYKGAVLKADTIYLDNKNQMIKAYGHPVIRDRDQPEIMGYRLKYNHKRQIGEVYYGTTHRDNQTFNGVEVRRQKSGEIQIARGDFSTCDNLEDQHFFFYGRRMVLEPGQKVLARPVVMNLSGVPVAVVPMLVVPLGTGRRSGFTRPKWGGDQAHGFYMRDIGYYWSMNDYMDFQLLADLKEGDRGTFDENNLSGVYNYNRRGLLDGYLNGELFMSEFNPQNSKWEVNFSHNQNLTPDGSQRLTGTGRFVSDRTVLYEALDEQEAVEQTANARLGYSRNLTWNRARLNVNAVQEYNLTSGQQTREFPAASFAFGAPLFPLKENDYWHTDADNMIEPPWYRKINYSYDGNISTYAEKIPGKEGVNSGDTNTAIGARNNIGLSAKYALLQYINVTPNANFSHYWNLQSRIGKDGAPKMDFTPEKRHIGDNLFKFSSSVNMNTKLYGLTQPNIGRWEKIRHVITPDVGFTWAPEIDSNKHWVSHPKLATSPFQPKQKTVSLGISNDVDIKLFSKDTAAEKKSVPYSIFSTSTRISHNFESEGRKWTDITSAFSSEIVKHIPLNLNIVHTLYDDYAAEEAARNEVRSVPTLKSYSFGWRKSIAAGGSMNAGLLKKKADSSKAKFEKTDWSANLDYGFSFSARRVSPAAFRRDLTHSFSGQFKLKPTPKWEMSYNTAYDFDKGEFSRHSFSFQRTLHCWKMDFHWTPVGIGQGWRFNIYVIDIPDIKLESSQTEIKTPSF